MATSMKSMFDMYVKQGGTRDFKAFSKAMAEKVNAANPNVMKDLEKKSKLRGWKPRLKKYST